MINKNCKACGNKISVTLSNHKRGWGNFCNKSCAAAYKAGFRPNRIKDWTKHSAWCAERQAGRDAGVVDLTTAAPVKAQVGKKVKIKPTYHSPSTCRKCGNPFNRENSSYMYLCETCAEEEEILNDMELGWDDHKNSM